MTTGDGQYRLQRGVLLKQWRGGQGDTQERAHSIWDLRRGTVPSLKLRIELHKAACEHQWAYTHSQCWELAVELIKDKSSATNWSRCSNRWFKIQFKHPVGCEHYAGVRRCGRGVEDAAWQGIIYVGTWLTPCIANTSQEPRLVMLCHQLLSVANVLNNWPSLAQPPASHPTQPAKCHEAIMI